MNGVFLVIPLIFEGSRQFSLSPFSSLSLFHYCLIVPSPLNINPLMLRHEAKTKPYHILSYSGWLEKVYI